MQQRTNKRATNEQQTSNKQHGETKDKIINNPTQLINKSAKPI